MEEGGYIVHRGYQPPPPRPSTFTSTPGFLAHVSAPLYLSSSNKEFIGFVRLPPLTTTLVDAFFAFDHLLLEHLLFKFTMESLVDIVTTGFQAVLAVAIVFTAGYALNGSQDVVFAKVSLCYTTPRKKWAHGTEH